MKLDNVHDVERALFSVFEENGFKASSFGDDEDRHITVIDKGAKPLFDVVVQQREEAFAVAIVRPGDRTLKGMPHKVDESGLMMPIGNRTAILGPRYPFGGEKLDHMLRFEMELARGTPTAPRQDADANEHLAQRLVDLAQEDPDAARNAIVKALADMAPPGVAMSLLEAVERHAPASGTSGPR